MKKLILLTLFLLFIVLANAQTQNICASVDCKSTVKYPVDTVILYGILTSQAPDSVKSAQWLDKLGGAKIDNPNAAATVARGLAAGGATLYVFQLTGTSNLGATSIGFDSVIYIPNQPPTAICGPAIVDSTSTTATLSGSNSTDPEGLPLTYLWSQLSGPNSASISSTTMANPLVSGLIVGTYIFNLTVTDSGGLKSAATQSVTYKVTQVKTVIVTTVVTTKYKSDGTTTTTTTTSTVTTVP